MQKTAAFFLSVIAFMVPIGTTYAQSSPKPLPLQNMSPAVPVHQWEYLTITFGKIRFTDPILNPSVKLSGDSKLLAYSKAGIVLAQEATDTQRQMDSLGKFGWELVGVVGEIGGDQELLFKRPFDSAQSKREAKLIAAEGEQLAMAQRAEAAKSLTQPLPTELVDLDAQERETATKANRKKEEQRLTEAVNSLKDFIFTSINALSTADSPNDSNVTVSVTVDGTSSLLTDGNKYRSSEAEAMAKKIADAIYDAAGLQVTQPYFTRELDRYAAPVKIVVTVIIKLVSETHEVANTRIGGKWAN